MSFCFSFSHRTIFFDLSGGPFVKFVFFFWEGSKRGGLNTQFGVFVGHFVKTRWPHQTKTNTHQSGLNRSLTSDPVATRRGNEKMSCVLVSRKSWCGCPICRWMPTRDFEEQCDRARVVVQAATSTGPHFHGVVHSFGANWDGISFLFNDGKGDESLFGRSPYSD